MGGLCLGGEGLQLLKLSSVLEALRGAYTYDIGMPFAGREVLKKILLTTLPFIGCRGILLQLCMTLYGLYKTLSRRVIGRVFNQGEWEVGTPFKILRDIAPR
jgi:hypothetical protein